ncbi:glycosyl transferase family 2 [Betaproteobacteria bacterium GR16-43]|nr:glycosyl transferase family 2 [Betaproteobacteria bacterium GR16-43]
MPSPVTFSFLSSANETRNVDYVGVGVKFFVALSVAIGWLALSIWLAMPWIRDLAELTHWSIALFAVGGIAIIPGFMNAFLLSSLLMDRRPQRVPLAHYPALTILVAAFNEGKSIAGTLKSIESQRYPGAYEVFVIDDGSTDDTAEVVAALHSPNVTLVRQPKNSGKSAALNRGLSHARFGLVVTLDGDSFLHVDALKHLVERYASDPEHTRAVAGAMLVGNSRTNWVTRMQEWDYFHGIAATKRIQSLYQGTLVAQGAFSIYDRQLLIDLGGWDECVGEDIVLTWAILSAGWRVGHAEDAVCFTNAPTRLGQFLQQRLRWARGMMEAFRRHPGILFKPRLSTTFVWWNLFFPWIDVAFTVFFIPGIVLALFGIYWIAGPMTLILLPLSLLMNGVMYRVNAAMFEEQGLRVRFNPLGFVLYAVAYSVILQPACVAGYLSELFGWRRRWGTK